MTALILLLLVLMAIACRKFVKWHLPIWLITFSGALLALALQQISLPAAFKAIDYDVLLYLFAVFAIAQGLERSGYLEQLTERCFKHQSSGIKACLIITLLASIGSMILMNDTVAIIGTVVILQLCKNHKQLTPPLLLTLAFAITTSSVTSPVGNPQNLLIALQTNMPQPFITFFRHLFIPTLLNLLLTVFFVWLYYRRDLATKINNPQPPALKNPHLAKISIISLLLLVALIIINIVLPLFTIQFHFRLSVLAIIASLPIFLLSRERIQILRHLDWGTLLFFAALFVLVHSVWDTGILQTKIQSSQLTLSNDHVTLLVSCLLSQLISNVPMVALYLPLLQHLHTPIHSYLALAAGSTIAGNLLIFGAASNIIIIQNAEKKAYTALGFYTFARIGIPLTITQLVIYWLCL